MTWFFLTFGAAATPLIAIPMIWANVGKDRRLRLGAVLAGSGGLVLGLLGIRQVECALAVRTGVSGCTAPDVSALVLVATVMLAGGLSLAVNAVRGRSGSTGA